MLNQQSKRSGFTIVELLVVIVVIGILAALTIVSYTGIAQKAAAVSLQTDLKNASTQLELYKTDNNDQYPPDDGSLPKSDGTDYQYTIEDGEYYLSATSTAAGNSAYYISSVSNQVLAGVWEGHLAPGQAPPWQEVVVGYQHTCATTLASQDYYCVGRNRFGQFGDGTSGENAILSFVAITPGGDMAGKTIKTIASGIHSTCAISSDDKAYCWGYNAYGQLGIGNQDQKLLPVAVNTSNFPGDGTVKSITMGEYTTCAIASDDKAYCWGYNHNGQVGDGTAGIVNSSYDNKLLPVAVDTSILPGDDTVKSISAGQNHVCTIASDDKAYCWGDNLYYGLGDDTNVDKYTPVAVHTDNLPGDKTVKSISSGYRHTCAIASDDKAYCWGYNQDGQVGDDTAFNTKHIPVAINTDNLTGDKTIKSILAGRYYTCAIAFDDKAYCWGDGWSGNLGTGSTSDLDKPTAVVSTLFDDKNVTYIADSSSHACAVTPDQIYCWGSDEYGELGDGLSGTGVKSTVPVTALTPSF